MKAERESIRDRPVDAVVDVLVVRPPVDTDWPRGGRTGGEGETVTTALALTLGLAFGDGLAVGWGGVRPSRSRSFDLGFFNPRTSSVIVAAGMLGAARVVKCR